MQKSLPIHASTLTLSSIMLFKDLLTNSHINILPITLVAVSGFLINHLFKDSKYDKLFRMCGLENKENKIPIVIDEDIKDTITTLVIHLPEGLSQKHFEQKQQELEQNLNAKIEFGFNENLIMKLTTLNLQTMYDFIFEESDKPLQVYCGEGYDGKFLLDIEKCPHAIIAGETDSGKSSLLDTITLSLIFNEHNIDLHLVDFQAVTLGKYELCKKVKSYLETPEELDTLLDELQSESESRLKLFRSVKHKIFIDKLSIWNKTFPDKALPYKVIIIDEFARLSEKKYDYILEKFRTRVAFDRKAGIHYLIAMQRPDVKCIEGSIKANMPTRIAFRTVTQVDSEVILDKAGAEKLKHQGRFLVKYCGEIQEVQGLYIHPSKIRNLLKKNNKFKTKEEIRQEKNEKMEELRSKCINPYKNKDVI